jgi:hypothetical protein
MRFVGILLLFTSVIILVPGCSSGNVGPSVKGQVLLDNKPVAGARVAFHGKGGAQTVTDQDGKFFLDGTAFKSVQPGKYIVRITKYVDKKTGKVPETDDLDNKIAAGEVKNELPAHYGAAEENPLIADISAGANELKPFELKSK